MGNQLSLRPSNAATAKIVLWDGSIHDYEQPLTVAELMLEHPQQVVVEFDSALTTKQKRPTPLPADKMLQMNKVYLMLPVKKGKPVSLTSHDGRRILLAVNSALRSKEIVCSSRLVPWLLRLAGGEGGTRDAGGGVRRREEETVRCEISEFLMPEMMRPEYLSRQLSAGSNGWRPSLDTIKEKKIEKKLNHWLFINGV
ncbi:uncharacterized protein LOC130940861 [Arachis stenosperma]|uniref:uncharacterized protein LOC130940861 n=1 Tax=Arachis stenosperma TaxID=217475 RepID=UPI0025AD25D5|nr:uncharacterized protein LOC130940861 [Arachis stenosperma]